MFQIFSAGKEPPETDVSSLRHQVEVGMTWVWKLVGGREEVKERLITRQDNVKIVESCGP